jgi:hypothetical protein
MTWRTLGALAAALAIVGVTIALLGPNHGNAVNAIDPVAQAADTTAASGTAEFGIAGTVTAAGQSIPLNGTGAIDMPHNRMRMSIGFPLPGFGQLSADEIFDGKTIYIHFPESLTQRLPGAKPWMKLDLQSLGKSVGVDVSQLAQTSQNSPSNMLQWLKAVGSSRVVGHEDIHGAPTTHYNGSIDLNKVADEVPGDQAAAIKQLFKSSGLSSFPVDVWVDRSGRVRREGIKISANDMSMDMTIDFTRFGVQVDTSPPAADQVTDMSALLSAAGALRSNG